MTSSIDLRSSKTMNDQQQLCGRTEGLLLAHCKKRDCRATGDVAIVTSHSTFQPNALLPSYGTNKVTVPVVNRDL